MFPQVSVTSRFSRRGILFVVVDTLCCVQFMFAESTAVHRAQPVVLSAGSQQMRANNLLFHTGGSIRQGVSYHPGWVVSWGGEHERRRWDATVA